VAWLGGPLETIAPKAAHARLLRAYLAAFGPATTTDLRWWTGWTAARTTATIEAIGAIEVALDDGSGWLLPGDLAPTTAPGPWVALLPSLDATPMGWKERAWFLGDHAPALFDRNGNAGPTVWADGRVVGGWGRTGEGSIAVRLLEKVPAATERRIAREAAAIEAWLGTARPIPRFRSPLERELEGR
jgi:hypothetical protein